MRGAAAVVATVLSSCGGSQSTSTSTSTSTSGACTADAVCLRTVGNATPLKQARLVVVWESIDERSRPEVAFDVSFRGDERALAIPHAKIARPGALTKVMPCDPEGGERCRRGVGFAVGFVLVLRDSNANGRIDPEEVGKKSVIGAARVIVGFAEDAIDASPDLAPAGMTIGLASYEPVRVRMFDKWKLVPPRTVFELVVCAPTEADCDPPIPNVT